MKTKWIGLFCLFAILAILLGLGANAASANAVPPQNNVPNRVENIASRLTDVLTKAGFEVARGYFKLYTIPDCQYTYPALKSCFYNNPAAPYVLPLVPYWANEWVDPALQNAWGPTEPGYNGVHRFDEREAVLILGLLPPKGAYFGVQSWIFSRQDTYDTSSYMYNYIKTNYPQGVLDAFFHTLPPPDEERVQTFDSLSNITNNVVIEQQSGAAFNQLRYFIITPDQTMDSKLRAALDKISIQAKDIFTEPIPSTMRIGLNQEADDFITIIRYAEPKHIAQADQWRTDLPLIVLRIRPTNPDWEPAPYGPPVLEPRTALNEFPLSPDLDNLVEAVFDHWSQPYDPGRVWTNVDLQTEFDLVGPHCLQIGMDCIADSQDTTYQGFPGGFLMTPGRVLAYAGVLGTETGNATYVGLGVNNVNLKLGVYNLSGQEMKGSAASFANQVNNTDKLYLHYFARSCAGLETLTGGACTEITPGMIPLCTDPTGLTCQRITFSERDYIFPGTRRGPDSAFILPAKVIILNDPRP